MYNLCIRSQSSTKPHVDNTTRALTVVVGEGLLHGLSSPRLQYILNPLMCCDTATRRSPLSGPRAGLSDPSGYSWRSRDIHNMTPPYCSEQLRAAHAAPHPPPNNTHPSQTGPGTHLSVLYIFVILCFHVFSIYFQTLFF